MEIKGLVIEKKDVDLIPRNPVKVTFNYDITQLLGLANIYKEDNVLKADIKLNTALKRVQDLAGKALYPSVGFTSFPPKIFEMAFTLEPNEDETIEPIIIK